jgi:hypothetical protein
VGKSIPWQGATLIFALALICGLSSCGRLSAGNDADAASALQTFYAQEVSLPDSVSAVNAISQVDSENILLLTETAGGTMVMQWNMDSAQCLVVFAPEDASVTWVSAIPARSDFWCITESSDETSTLCHITSQGQPDAQIPLFDRTTGRNVAGLDADSSGNVYVYWQEAQEKEYIQAGILSYDIAGQDRLSLDDLSTEGCLLRDETGTVLFAEDMQTVYPIDSTGQQYDLETTCERLFYGTNQELWGTDGAVLYAYSKDGTTPILRFSDCGILGNPYIDMVLSAGEDSYLVLANAELYLLRPGTSPEKTDGRTAITIGTLGVSPALSEAVAQFNADNAEYRAEIIDYSTYGSTDDTSTGLNLFRMQLLSGNGPDVIAFGYSGNSDISGIDAQTLYSTGFLADLYPYLSADSTLSQSSFVPELLAALDTDGKLYELPTGFYIRSAAGSADHVGNQHGWTFSDMLEAAAAMPDLEYAFGSTIQRQRLMELLLAFNSDAFVDYETGECKFDTPEFIELLEFLNCSFTSTEGQREIPAYAVAAGRQMLGVVQIGTVVELQEYEAVFDDLVFVGMPATAGTGTAFSLTNSLGMYAATQHPDGAWAFLRFMNLGAYFTGFSANADRLNAYLAAPWDYDAYDMTIGYDGEDGTSWEIALQKPSREDAEQIRDLITLADRVYRPDDEICSIVWDEAAAYFSGEKSAEEVANLIQSRVQIYVNEQR